MKSPAKTWPVRCIAFAITLALCTAGQAGAQLALPHEALAVPFSTLGSESVYTIDLGTVAPRPFIEVEVTADAAHPDLVVEVEFDQCTLIGSDEDGDCFLDQLSSAGSPASVINDVWSCEPVGPFAGETCDVEVRVLDFGAAGAPAQLDVRIESKTKIMTSLVEVEYDPTIVPVIEALPAFRDTTIYEADTQTSNGLGQSIVVGEILSFSGFPPVPSENLIHGLISFDVAPTIPADAVIDDVEIILEGIEVFSVLLPISVQLGRVADDGNPFSNSGWTSGNADAADPELVGDVSTLGAATWLVRTAPPSDFWDSPGGDTVGAPLDTVTAALGAVSFQSPALLDAVRDMHATGRDRDGFLLKPTGLASILGTQAVRFASGENQTTPSIQPVMIVEYTPSEPAPVSGTPPTGAVPFVDEGENLRWIYDEEIDGILETAIDGRCTMDPDVFSKVVPYEYTFLGNANYEGLDCCAWKIESAVTGTVGTGQAIFFINLNANDPANFPGDFDGDGMRDLCDNCPYTPNGPLLGTCMGGTNDGQTCQSILECGGGGTCSQGQEDDDFELPGLACPEPGTSSALLIGTAFLATITRRRPKIA